MRAYVIGVGMTPFVKAGTSPGYPQLVAASVGDALADAGIGYDEVQRAAVGYVFQPSAAGQRALYDVGLTGIPIVNVNNNCATGSTALMLAREWVQAGLADVALAVGFEEMNKTAMAPGQARVTTIDRHLQASGLTAPVMTAFFGDAATEHMSRYGTVRPSRSSPRSQ